jgi:hypothetical protein
MKRAFIILAVFTMMLGANLQHGAMMFVGPSAAAEEGADPKAPHPEFDYIKLDPITLPVITTKGLTQQVSLVVQLEVAWGKKDEIAPYEPRLTDAYLQDLYGALGAGHGLMKDNVVDIAGVRDRLTVVTDKVLGPDHKVHAVLLQALQQRPM